jgi:hypothetical protein
MAINAGKFRIRGVDMDEIMTLRVNLFKRFAAPLRENEVTRFAVAGFNRHRPVGCDVFAVVAPKASIPVLVSDKIGIGAPIDFHFREKILAIDCLGFIDDRIRLRRVGISFA